MNTDIVVAFISSGFGLVGILAGIIIPVLIRQGRVLKAVQEDGKASRAQVENSHGTNLRDDMDRLTRKVDEGFDRVFDALNTFRTDLSWEHREGMDLTRRVERLEKAA